MAGALVLGAVSAPARAQPGGIEGQVSLRLLVQENPGPGVLEAAQDLVRFAAELSDGAIAIEPAFDGRDASSPHGRERLAVTSAAMTGEADLAILPSREWHAAGVRSLDALDAPFLIDNDALALAVASSDVASTAMSGLRDVGVEGLALWPDDLRHMYSFEPSGRVFRTPEDVGGATILALGAPGIELVEALGATVWVEGDPYGDFSGDRERDAATGKLHGMVAGLWGLGVPLGVRKAVATDVVLHPKYEVLVANSASMAGLSDSDRELLDEAIDAMLAGALDRYIGEPELGAARCAEGIELFAAGPDAVAAFVETAAPVYERVANDETTGPIVAAIEALKAGTPPSASAAVCAPTDAGSTTEALARVTAGPGFAGTSLVPSGIYRVGSTAAELVAAGAREQYANANAGVWTLTIDGDAWQAVHDVREERCAGSLEVTGDAVRFETLEENGCGIDYDLRWRLDAETLSLQLADLVWSDDPQVFTDERTFVERPWIRIAGD